MAWRRYASTSGSRWSVNARRRVTTTRALRDVSHEGRNAQAWGNAEGQKTRRACGDAAGRVVAGRAICLAVVARGRIGRVTGACAVCLVVAAGGRIRRMTAAQGACLAIGAIRSPAPRRACLAVASAGPIIAS